jgi:hypothetical protein
MAQARGGRAGTHDHHVGSKIVLALCFCLFFLVTLGASRRRARQLCLVAAV